MTAPSKRFQNRVGFYFKQLTGNDLGVDFDANTLKSVIPALAQDRASAKSVSRALCAAKSGESLSRCGKKLETKSAAISAKKYTNKYEEIALRFPASTKDWTDANYAEWSTLKPSVQKAVGAEIQNQYNARKWPIGSSASVLKSDGRFNTGKIKRYYLANNGSGMFDAVLLEFSDKTTGIFYFTQLLSS